MWSSWERVDDLETGKVVWHQGALGGVDDLKRENSRMA